MRILFWLAAIAIIVLLVRARWQRWRRHRRGEPEPIQRGPRTITLVIIALLLVYGLLIGYRVFVGDWDTSYGTQAPDAITQGKSLASTSVHAYNQSPRRAPFV